MTIKEILKGTKKDIVNNIEALAEAYKKETGRRLNKSCPSCVNEMVLILKGIYNMTQFKFKRPAASYKSKKGDKVSISNSTMTDEKAIEFLKEGKRQGKNRIELFSVHPSNWKELIEGKVETQQEKANRLAIEAELKAAEEGKGGDLGKAPESAPEKTELPEGLEQMKLSELRALYPDIKARGTVEFIKELKESLNKE